MVRRVVMGGSPFKFRASKPGVNAETAPIGQSNYQFHENMMPMAADRNGSVTIAAGGSTNINIGTGYANNPPMILLNAGDGQAMGTFITAQYVLSTGILTISNSATVSKTVRYAILIDY